MFLSSYHFDGEPAAPASAHDQLIERLPVPTLGLHLRVHRDRGIMLLVTCPTRAEFVVFSRSAEFRDALAAAGLPRPRLVEPLGEVRSVHVGDEVTT